MSGAAFANLKCPRRVHPIVYTVVSNNMATFAEVAKMSIDELLDVYEICVVSVYNRNEVARQHQEGLKNG